MKKKYKAFHNAQYYRFCSYGFLKNLRLFDPFILLFFKSAGFSYFEIGLFYAAREITTNVLEIPSGIVADLFGRRRAMLMAFSAYLASFTMIYLSSDFKTILSAMLLFGFGEAFRSGTHKAIIMNYLEHRGWLKIKTEYYGSTRSWSQSGSAIAGLAGMLTVLFTSSYRAVFLVTLIPYLINFVLLWKYPKDKQAGTFSLTGIGEAVRNQLSSFFRTMKLKRVARTIFSAAMYSGFFKSLKDYIQPVVVLAFSGLVFTASWGKEQNSAIPLGVLYFLIYLVNAVAARHAYLFEKWQGGSNTSADRAYLIGGISILVSGLCLLSGYALAGLIFYLPLFIMHNIRRPIMVGIMSQELPETQRAAGLSAESQLKTLVATIVAPLFGLAADHAGLAPALVILAALFLLAFPLSRLTESKKKG